MSEQYHYANSSVCQNFSCGQQNQIGQRFCSRCTAPLPLLPGTVLQGKFIIEGLLSFGSFGNIYLGKDVERLDKYIAIEEMSYPDEEGYVDALNSFRQERDFLQFFSKGSLLPQFHAYFEVARDAFIVEELIDGDNLEEALKTRLGGFPLKMIVAWGKEICSLFHLMHERAHPIFLYSLTPKDIWLTSNRDLNIKLLPDWYLTHGAKWRVKQRRNNAAGNHVSRWCIQSLAMPQEQLIGIGAKAGTDFHHLASLLFLLATGENAEGFITGAQLEIQMSDPNCGWSQAERLFYDLIRVNLAERVEERFRSANQFKEALDAIANACSVDHPINGSGRFM